MNEIKIFNNPQFGDIRTAGTADNPMFCLADLCRALEIKKVSRVKDRLNQRGVTLVSTPTLNQHGAEVMQEMEWWPQQSLV